MLIRNHANALFMVYISCDHDLFSLCPWDHDLCSFFSWDYILSILCSWDHTLSRSGNVWFMGS